MQITLNTTELTVAESITVQQLLNAQDISEVGLAIAINNTVLAKRLWPAHQLQQNDALQLFQLVTGG
ncbi:MULTISPECIES: sulfur carrier protein ThiS [Rheinheimera]|uniref:sulfur carrier protein ThiS n=1 Tax=Rheinheimera TaxID=67575 RepID=UPI001404C55D|nr:sulfur carrier protein ThiS [Rheinheimera sp. D18]